MRSWIVALTIVSLPACGPVESGQDDAAVDVEDVASVEQALSSCPYKNYLCGNDGLSAPSNNLYLCSATGATPSFVQTCTYGCQIVSGANDKCYAAPASPIVISSTEKSVLTNGNYDTSGWLLWANSASGTLKGGTSFSSSYKTSVGSKSRVNAYGDSTGQCVSMVKSLSGRTGATTGWSKGQSVTANCGSLQPGTAVATFFGANGTYSGHAGFLASCTSTQIVLWDQNYSYDGTIRKHTISKTGTNTVGDAGAYYVINAP